MCTHNSNWKQDSSWHSAAGSKQLKPGFSKFPAFPPPQSERTGREPKPVETKFARVGTLSSTTGGAEGAGQVLPILERTPVVLRFSLWFQLEELFIALLRIQQSFGRFR